MSVSDMANSPLPDAHAITAELDTLFTGALRVLDMPSAVISLIENEQIVHTYAQLATHEQLRNSSLITAVHRHLIRTDRTLVLDDAAKSTDSLPLDNTRSTIRALAAFPLHGPDGAQIGTLTVADSSPHHWTSHDIAMLDMLARAAMRELLLFRALSREAEMRRQAEHLTLTLKDNLMPLALPTIPGLEVGASFNAAGMGIDVVGDFYDIIATGRNTWSFVVGDVCGKGVGAAKAATFARHIVRTHALQGLSPKHVMKSLNSTMYMHTTETNAFLTAVYGEATIDPKQCLLRVTSAGHMPPVIRRRDTSIRELKINGVLLGVMPQIDLDECYVNLNKGDALIAFTDGVNTGRAGDDVYGTGNVCQRIAEIDIEASAQEIADQLVTAILAGDGSPARDDIAILVLRRPYSGI